MFLCIRMVDGLKAYADQLKSNKLTQNAMSATDPRTDEEKIACKDIQLKCDEILQLDSMYIYLDVIFF